MRRLNIQEGNYTYVLLEIHVLAGHVKQIERINSQNTHKRLLKNHTSTQNNLAHSSPVDDPLGKPKDLLAMSMAYDAMDRVCPTTKIKRPMLQGNDRNRTKM